MAVKLPFIQWRNGRPKFKPSGRERDLGFQGQDLRHPNNGAWFTYEETRAWIYGEDGKSGIYAQILKARKTGKPIIVTTPPRADRNVEALVLDWLRDLQNDRSEDRLSENSITSYVKDANALLYRPETRDQAKARRLAKSALGEEQPREKEPFAQLEIRLLGVPELNAHFKYLKEARGHHMALHAISALSCAWAWGQKSTTRRPSANPRHQLELKRPEGRIVLVPAHEIAALVAANDALGRHSGR